MIVPERLPRRVLQLQLAFSGSAALVLAVSVPMLVQVNGQLRWDVGATLAFLVWLGTAVSAVVAWLRMKKYRFVLQAFSLDKREGKSPALDVDAVAAFAHEPGLLTVHWLLSHAVTLLILLSPLRPEALDWTATIAVVMLTALMLATASLPMHVLVRRDFLDLLELAPAPLMYRVMQQHDKAPSTRSRINRRIVIAVTTPVLFVALGSALIVNAHLRKDDETQRELTARLLARSVLEVEPGGIEGLERALDRAAEQGFFAQIASPDARHGVIIERGGIAELTTPLDSGSAQVRFSASTVGVLSAAPVLVSLLATVAAAIIGFLLGNVLSMDLYFATRGVRLLGASAAALNQHTGVLRPPRLALVAELAEAIDRLTTRFTVFAKAQEKAIEARAATVRARGLFFASVSHDLKAPLNSILGFTHLVSLQPLSAGQRESLDAIHTRAVELLALIETILDAARVEEGQLSLVTDEVPFKELYDKSVEKAQQLSAAFAPQIFEEIEDGIPPALVDRTRVVRAIATLIAYSVRSNEGGKMWIRAERENEATLRIDIDVPRPAHSPTQLEWMLSPSQEHRQREHRGLALGLRLARSVVQLHNGSVRVIDRGKKGAMFCVKLPTVEHALPTASAPVHSIPPPPSSAPPRPSLPPPEFESSLPPPPRLPSDSYAAGEPHSARTTPASITPTSSLAPGPFVSSVPPGDEEPTGEMDFPLPPPPPLSSQPPPPPLSSSLPGPMRSTPLPVAPHRPIAVSETPLPPSSRPFSTPPDPPPSSSQLTTLDPPPDSSEPASIPTPPFWNPAARALQAEPEPDAPDSPPLEAPSSAAAALDPQKYGDDTPPPKPASSRRGTDHPPPKPAKKPALPKLPKKLPKPD